MVGLCQRKFEPVAWYNSSLSALLCLLSIDIRDADVLLKKLEQYDSSLNQIIKITEFAKKYCGKYYGMLVVLFLLYQRLLMEPHADGEGVGGLAGAASGDDMQSKLVFETLTKATSPVEAPYFHFLAFLFHFQSLEEDELLDYIYFLLTKGQRTVDRSEIALMLQLILMENKDKFLLKFKETIELLLVEQASEPIAHNRFQFINASFGGIFSRYTIELRNIIKRSLVGRFFWKRSIRLSKKAFRSTEAAYDKLTQFSKVGATAEMIDLRKQARKDVRQVLRIAIGFRQFKESSNALFSRSGCGDGLIKIVALIRGAVSNAYKYIQARFPNGVTSKIFPEKKSYEDRYKEAKPVRQPVRLPWQKPLEPPPPEEPPDPFAFEKRLLHCLEEPTAELFDASRSAQEEAKNAIAECEGLLNFSIEPSQEIKDMMSNSVRASKKRRERKKGPNFDRMGTIRKIHSRMPSDLISKGGVGREMSMLDGFEEDDEYEFEDESLEELDDYTDAADGDDDSESHQNVGRSSRKANPVLSQKISESMDDDDDEDDDEDD